MYLGLTDRTAVVCASSRGLGRACALALAEAGCRVIVNGRGRDRVDETTRNIRSLTGADVVPVVADVTTAEGREHLLSAAGHVDVLITNAEGPPFRNFLDLNQEGIATALSRNMIAPIALIQSVLPSMTARGFGRIVNITSGSVKMPVAGLDLSSGARGGLTAFLAGVARQVARKNVTINFLLPGAFETDRLHASVTHEANLTGRGEEEVRRSRLDGIPAGRFGRVDEFGKTCAFLCSEHAAFITGQNILLDGGAYPGLW